MWGRNRILVTGTIEKTSKRARESGRRVSKWLLSLCATGAFHVSVNEFAQNQLLARTHRKLISVPRRIDITSRDVSVGVHSEPKRNRQRWTGKDGIYPSTALNMLVYTHTHTRTRSVCVCVDKHQINCPYLRSSSSRWMFDVEIDNLDICLIDPWRLFVSSWSVWTSW